MIDSVRKLIVGGQVVLPDDLAAADVLIEGDKIAAIAQPGSLVALDAQVIDAAGCYVFPGIIDAHTHINLDTGIYQTVDGWAAGTRAAAFGGVTTVIDFANQIKGEDFAKALAARSDEAADAAIDYSFHMVVIWPDENPEKLRETLREISDLGMPSIKLFTTYRPNYYTDDTAILRVFEAMPDDMIALVHCENDSIVTEATQQLLAEGKTSWAYHAKARPALAEAEAANRILYLADRADARVFIAHNSLSDTTDMVANARMFGQPAFCETCPQYLLLDDSVYDGAQPQHYILQPPIRPKVYSEQLRQLVIDGAVDVLSTDSCDYALAQKLAEPNFTKTPGGLPGIETLLPLMFTTFCQQMPLPDLIKLMTENPARLYGLYPRKGVIRVGSDADLVIYDPEPERDIHVNDMHFLAGYTPFEGMPVKGKVKTVLSRGEVIVDGDDYYGMPGRGQYVQGGPSLDPR